MLKELTRTQDLTRTGWCKVHQGPFQPGGHYDRERLLAVGICGECDFWTEKWQMRNDSNVARIDGNHYIIGQPDSTIRGMGGVQVRIKFNDGREAMTNNLWHQGKIPEFWHNALPDNASFIELGMETEG